MAERDTDLTVLDPSDNEGYGGHELPTARDAEIRDLLRTHDAAWLEGSLDAGNARVLAAFAERMASLAVRTHSRETLADGVRGAGIAWGLGEPRDLLLIFAPLYDAAERIGVGGRDAFRAAARDVPMAGREALLSFAERSDEDRSLAAMGYVEGADASGFRYERTW